MFLITSSHSLQLPTTVYSPKFKILWFNNQISTLLAKALNQSSPSILELQLQQDSLTCAQLLGGITIRKVLSIPISRSLSQERLQIAPKLVMHLEVSYIKSCKLVPQISFPQLSLQLLPLTKKAKVLQHNNDDSKVKIIFNL
jgi:hypothetical protein